MKRYARNRNAILPLDHNVDRWAELARVVKLFIAGDTTRERLRVCVNRTRTLHVIGQAGPLNRCARLREEVMRHLDPPRVQRGRPGIDYDALTADNTGEMSRMASEVLALIEARAAVDDAARRL